MNKNKIPQLNEKEETELRKLSLEKGLTFWQAYDLIKKDTLQRFL